MPFVHRVRAVIALGLTWSISWAIVGVGFITWRIVLAPPRLAFPLRYWPRFALHSGLVFGSLGLIAGMAFAITLRRRARGRTIDGLSLAFAARWGGVAGAAALLATPLFGPVSRPLLLVGGSVFAAVGAASAVATLRLARRSIAGRRPPTAPAPPPALSVDRAT